MTNLALALSKANVEKLSDSVSSLSILAELSQLSDFDANSRAALHLLGADKKVDSWVSYASPVLIQPNRDHLAITQAEGFALDFSEAADLCAEFNDHFKDDGLSFSFTEPDIWFCTSKENHFAALNSPTSIIGENILAYLPSDMADVHWRKMFNETQMLLHHSVTNQRRILSGKPEINSLWFWGGGVLPMLPKPFSPAFDHIMTDNLEITGFAKLSQAQTMELPNNLQAETFDKGNDYILVLDLEFSDDIVSLIDQYVKEGVQLLKDKTIETLCIVPDYGQKYSLSAVSLKKFWKMPKSISTFL